MRDATPLPMSRLFARMVAAPLIALSLWALALTSGCASSNQHPPKDSNLAVVSDQVEGRSRALLHGGERGLEVRQWLVADDTDLITSVMATRSTDDVLSAGTRERLARNGLRLVRLPIDELDELEAQLGGSTVHNTGWYGQVADWQELLTHHLPQQRAVAIDGRVRLLEQGQLRLMTRAWIVQMEDGSQLNVQVVPQHFQPAPMTYYRLLGRDTGHGAAIASMKIDVLLDEGFAYVLTCESPTIEWGPSADSPAAGRSASQALAGPSVPAATTVGQLLLRTEEGMTGRPGRALLILVPHVYSSPDMRLDALSKTLRSSGAESRQ